MIYVTSRNWELITNIPAAALPPACPAAGSKISSTPGGRCSSLPPLPPPPGGPPQPYTLQPILLTDSRWPGISAVHHNFIIPLMLMEAEICCYYLSLAVCRKVMGGPGPILMGCTCKQSKVGKMWLIILIGGVAGRATASPGRLVATGSGGHAGLGSGAGRGGAHRTAQQGEN